jgi:hypothetical protein
VTAVAARVAAEAQKVRDGLEARVLAGELGCQVTPHPELAGRAEARGPLPGWHLLIGTPQEVREAVTAELRRRGLLGWLSVLGSQGNHESQVAADAPSR